MQIPVYKLRIAMASNDASDALAGTSTQEVQVEGQSQGEASPPTVRLTLRKPQNEKKVSWTSETVDNEHMDKKKSKCCCIYHKPLAFGESSSSEEDDDDCEHCRGHKKKKVPHSGQDGGGPGSGDDSHQNGTVSGEGGVNGNR